jgi:PAS domain-containing protein
MSSTQINRLIATVAAEQLRIEEAVKSRRRGMPNLSPAFLEELATSLEELGVVLDELQSKGDELAGTRGEYDQFFNMLPDACVTTDSKGVIREANSAAAALFDCSPLVLKGKPLAVFIAKEESKTFYGQLNAVTDRDAPAVQHWQFTVRPHPLQSIATAMTLGLVRNSRGRLTALRWFIRTSAAQGVPPAPEDRVTSPLSPP